MWGRASSTCAVRFLRSISLVYISLKMPAAIATVKRSFTAKLVDVYPPNADYPAGGDLNVADSIVRDRYHNGFGKAELLKPRQPYELTIEMYPTSWVCLNGAPDSLDISSSNFPRFDVNPNREELLNNNAVGRSRITRFIWTPNTHRRSPCRSSHRRCLVVPSINEKEGRE